MAMADIKLSFLDFPVEIRLQIYNLALRPSRLRTRAILDPEWLFAADRTCLISPLLFASKQIYREAVTTFYAKATLEMSPCQRDPVDGRGIAEYGRQYEDDHAFCPSKFLQAITNVHVYSDQAWPVDQDAFQAMFQWLVKKTGVNRIYLSRKIMQQNRHIPELICLNNLSYDVSKQVQNTRIIDVYARNISSRLIFWDNQGVSFANRTKPLPDLQSYFSSAPPHQCGQPQLLRDTETAPDKEELLKRQIERFAHDDLADIYLKQAHVDGYLWLYKTIQIHKREHKTETLHPDLFSHTSAVLAH